MNFCASVVPSYIFLNFYFEFTCTMICINNFVSASVLKLPDFCTVHICFNYIDCCNCCLCVCACVPECVCVSVLSHFLTCIESLGKTLLSVPFFTRKTHSHTQPKCGDAPQRTFFRRTSVCVRACGWAGVSVSVCVYLCTCSYAFHIHRNSLIGKDGRYSQLELIGKVWSTQKKIDKETLLHCKQNNRVPENAQNESTKWDANIYQPWDH